VFNFVFIQNLVSISGELSEQDRQQIFLIKRRPKNELEDYFLYINNYLNDNNFKFLKATTTTATTTTIEQIKTRIEKKCLHFLKFTSLLKSYLFNSSHSMPSELTFENLIKHLSIPSYDNLKWANSDNKYELINYWLNEIIKASDQYKDECNELIRLSFDSYKYPDLLELPRLYSDLFNYYSSKKCEFCDKMPKETVVCLLCGARVCYKSHYCCEMMRNFCRHHLTSCGANSLPLININTTVVFVVRGKRCAPWASLYLDEHGEEDQNLRYFLNQI
jgi:E3 ubiquitin-protein ligase UBR3